MSARIVQVVTAEAVAVVKGEQEKEAQHKDQPGPLPLGKMRRRMFKVFLCLQMLYVCILQKTVTAMYSHRIMVMGKLQHQWINAGTM